MLKNFRIRQEFREEQRAQEALAPKVGEAAPDFTLYDPSGEQAVTLSELVGKKPVALVFGSFT
jgi:peroxiredoxin